MVLPPIPGRRSVRLGGKVYDRDQVTAIVSLLLVALVLLRDSEAVVEAVTDPQSASVATSASLAAVLDVAGDDVGTTEARDKGTPFHDAYGIARDQPWCAVWLVVAFDEAGESDLIPRTAWTPAMAQWYRNRGQWSTTPQVGSLVFYDWPGDGKNRISHVGLVIGVEDGFIRTWEGNTRPGPEGDQSDGDGVYERRRPLNSSVVGFGHPAYTA